MGLVGAGVTSGRAQEGRAQAYLLRRLTLHLEKPHGCTTDARQLTVHKCVTALRTVLCE